MCKVLGIDTSNYTTSAAVFDTEKMTVCQFKKLLPVKKGEKGIRQSDAVFHHTKQMPQVLKEVLHGEEIFSIGVSVKPRLADDSYMPCFLVGETVAEAIGISNNIIPDKTSHQVGHILAALYSSDSLNLIHNKKTFIAFHVSGGTTDMLLCTPDDEKIIDVKEIGHSLDLKAGQVIDRTGVMLGLNFPCGVELEKLAKISEKKYTPKPVIKGLDCCLSGIENQVKAMYEKKEKSEDIAFFSICSVYSAIRAMTVNALKKYGDLPLIYAGGVMSNKYIAGKITQEFNARFAEPVYSSDNAVGVAIYSAYMKGLIK